MPKQPFKAEITVERVDEMQSGTRIWDTKVSGFFVRRQTKAKVYCLKYRIGGRQRWYVIGKHGSPWTPKTARDEAKRLLGALVEDKDPAHAKAKNKNAPTVAAVAKKFLTEHVEAKRKSRTLDGYKDIIDRLVVPAIGEMRIKDIDRADIAKLHQSLQATPYQANRTLAVISKLFNLAELWGERPDGSNPCRHVEKFPERKRERMLSAEELERLGDALRDAEDRCNRSEALDAEIAAARKNKDKTQTNKLVAERRDLGEITSKSAIAAIRLLVFTGARLSEILGLQWHWIDFEVGEARLPDSKTGAKTLHLPAPAMAVLAGLKREKDNPYVIVGQRAKTSLVNLEKPWRSIRNAATVYLWRNSGGEPTDLVNRLAASVGRQPTFEEGQAAANEQVIKLPVGLSNLRLHDLRHAFASVAASSGMGLPIIGKMLGHTQAQTTQRYAHLASDPVKTAQASVAGKIAAAMNGRSADVIHLPKQPT